ncbi:NB-ARC domain-containing protein [Brasilonema sp. UFV-L1]|uniref:NB-ARC domain-containing protein n=1 Tax=Brasilonema sp. UFV-L1 TaxID=2234130 RepID=UPI00145CEAEF|nr:NB-ARC domain-containing protein [Brasilonema sp. UFV-L1]NMG09501.1 hypothetical protein [Brasilonema sp. UFV-L1]
MSRSLRVRRDCIEKAKLAVRRNGFSSQRVLAENVGLALATVSNFLTGKPVDYGTFVDICQRLQLDCEEIAEYDVETQPQLEDRKIEVNSSNKQQYWGEAIDVSLFYGRNEEIATLKQWIVSERCRLVALIGMGGIGKTVLSAKLAQQIQDKFEYLIWQSLRHAPSLLKILTDINEFLTSKSQTAIPATIDGQISCLLNTLRSYRCLLIFDDWEMILRDAGIAGYYCSGYEGYGELLKRVGEEYHQSCLLLLSREKPVEVTSLAGETLAIRALKIKGLKIPEAKKLLATKGFSGLENGLEELIQLYRGHPAALKTIASTIQDLFNGNIAQFISQSSLVIGDIFSHLLDQQFERLSDLEKVIIYWLAIEYQPISLAKLKTNLGVGVSGSELVVALESLSRRSLIEKEETTDSSAILFTLQPVVTKYVINQFIKQICQDIIEAIQATSIEKLGLLKSHALVKEDESDDIKAIQIRLILTRVQEHLRLRLGDANRMQVQVKNLLSKLQGYSTEITGYAQYNLLKLL